MEPVGGTAVHTLMLSTSGAVTGSGPLMSISGPVCGLFGPFPLGEAALAAGLGGAAFFFDCKLKR